MSFVEFVAILELLYTLILLRIVLVDLVCVCVCVCEGRNALEYQVYDRFKALVEDITRRIWWQSKGSRF